MAKELTNAQKDELIEQYVELITDSMDVKTLEQFVRDTLTAVSYTHLTLPTNREV